MWKSQSKKFCDICKCWFADNPVSVRIHENGVKHKENVRQKLYDIGKQGKKKEKEERELNAELRQMEFSALQSYKRDLKDDPEAALQYNIHQNVAATVPYRPSDFGVPKPGLPQRPMFPGANEADLTGDTINLDTDSVERNAYACIAPPSSKYGGVGEQKLWAEAKTPDGYSYYWHTVSGKTRWEPPKDGYISVEEQQYQVEMEQRAAEKALLAEEEKKRKEAAGGSGAGQAGTSSTSAMPELIDLENEKTKEEKRAESYQEILAEVRATRAEMLKKAKDREFTRKFHYDSPLPSTSDIPLPGDFTDDRMQSKSDILDEMRLGMDEKVRVEKEVAKKAQSRAAKLIQLKLLEAKMSGNLAPSSDSSDNKRLADEVERELEREEEKEGEDPEEEDESKPSDEQDGPRKRANPYGSWERVETESWQEEEPEIIDLGLPKKKKKQEQTLGYREIEIVQDRDVETRFTEKRMNWKQLKRAQGETGFRRKKGGSGRSLRSRESDDD